MITTWKPWAGWDIKDCKITASFKTDSFICVKSSLQSHRGLEWMDVAAGSPGISMCPASLKWNFKREEGTDRTACVS